MITLGWVVVITIILHLISVLYFITIIQKGEYVVVVTMPLIFFMIVLFDSESIYSENNSTYNYISISGTQKKGEPFVIGTLRNSKGKIISYAGNLIKKDGSIVYDTTPATIKLKVDPKLPFDRAKMIIKRCLSRHTFEKYIDYGEQKDELCDITYNNAIWYLPENYKIK